MPTRKQIQPGDKVPLKLTAAEQTLILDELIVTERAYEELLPTTPTDEPMMMTLHELEEFGNYIAAEANHCEDQALQRKLDAFFRKVDNVLATYTVEPPTRANGRRVEESPDDSQRRPRGI